MADTSPGHRRNCTPQQLSCQNGATPLERTEVKPGTGARGQVQGTRGISPGSSPCRCNNVLQIAIVIYITSKLV